MTTWPGLGLLPTTLVLGVVASCAGLLGSCSVTGSERGGIGYSVRSPAGTAVLGSPAGKLPSAGERLVLRVGEQATIVAANEATADFRTRYRMVPDRPGLVRVVGDLLQAEATGETTVLVETLDHRSLVMCLREGAVSCNLLDVVVA